MVVIKEVNGAVCVLRELGSFTAILVSNSEFLQRLWPIVGFIRVC